MSETSFTTRVCLVTLALAGALFLAAPDAKAITYGEPDCEDNATNTGCWHPNTVSLTSFGYRGGSRLVSNTRGSGTLLAENADRFVILTAGHIANTFIERLANGVDAIIGVSFDAKIVVDMPWMGPIAWSPKQFLLGGQSVLNRNFGPQGFLNVFQHDYAIIVFEIPEAMRFKSDRFGRPRGEHVDLSEIPLVDLPEYDYLADKVGGANPLQLTTVGYGAGRSLNGPHEGGNAGGPEWDPTKVGVRWMTDQSPAFSFMGAQQNMLRTSQNPATGDAGSCGGDSGGPLFYVDDQGVEFQVAITSSGDEFCRGMAFNVRTDTDDVIEFLDCVMAPDAELEDILACGCTELTDKGVCPEE